MSLSVSPLTSHECQFLFDEELPLSPTTFLELCGVINNKDQPCENEPGESLKILLQNSMTRDWIQKANRWLNRRFQFLENPNSVEGIPPAQSYRLSLPQGLLSNALPQKAFKYFAALRSAANDPSRGLGIKLTVSREADRAVHLNLDLAEELYSGYEANCELSNPASPPIDIVRKRHHVRPTHLPPRLMWA